MIDRVVKDMVDTLCTRRPRVARLEIAWLKRVWVGLTLLAATHSIACAQADASRFPSQTVRFIVPVSPGSISDGFARLIADTLAKTWKRDVIVENRPGLPGVATVAKSEADGYTLLLNSNGHTIAGAINKTLPFDPVEDFTGVTLIATVPLVMIVPPNFPARTLAKFIELAKARPGQLAAIIRILVLVAALNSVAHAQTGYPHKPVRLIVPFAPGGVTDVVARLIGQKLGERLGQQFVVENHAGGGGNIGMGIGARAPADGYAILFVSSSYVINPSLYAKAPYDPEKDFVPITKAAASPNLWLVNPDVPAKSMVELIELIRASPGKFSVASPGIGTAPHLGIELLRTSLGLDYVVVPYGGGGPAVQATLAGHTQVHCTALANATNLIRDGKLRALGVAGSKRSSALPDIPTFAEQGIQGQEAETMQGVLVPAGTPREIVALLEKEISAIVNLPDTRERLISLGFEPEGTTAAEFDAYVRAEIARWRDVIQKAGIQPI
jgi:tripartite-type tricarboxylate transporter receptor subunit TctC